MNVIDLIDREPTDLDRIFVGSRDSANLVAQKLRESPLRVLLVVKSGKLLGIISEHDVIEPYLFGDRNVKSKLLALDLMSPRPVTVKPDQSLEKALSLCVKHSISHLPVVDEKKQIRGIVSLKQMVTQVLTTFDSLLGFSLDSQEGKSHGRARPDSVHLNPKEIMSKIDHAIEGFRESVFSEIKSGFAEGNSLVKDASINFDHLSILFCVPNSKSQRMAKVALSSTGAEIDFTADYEKAKVLVYEKKFDLVIVDKDTIKLAALARERDPQTKIIMLTFDSPETYIPLLGPYPYINNIVSLSHADHKFSIKGILSTVRKTTTSDIFGIEKYLELGSQINQEPICSSDQRLIVIKKMKTFFSELGLTKSLISRIAMVAEELLLNAIYDAPISSSGEPLYNNLDRRVQVTLRPHEQGTFHYGCDGSYVGIAATDPFGSIKKTDSFSLPSKLLF
ncbi:MAG: CBS domain-containing protein [Pseudobacteriovorax sp.]|nr:CBS domain-containing protein [Pseudobacteriovorax sp.]